jgi:hypothetical protein
MKKADQLQEKIAQVDQTESVNVAIDNHFEQANRLRWLRELLLKAKDKQKDDAKNCMREGIKPCDKEYYVNRLTIANEVYIRVKSAYDKQLKSIQE